jgi:branched-chain amino acid transport system ATP-binding protein
MTQDKPRLVVEDLHAGYGSMTVVSGVSLEVGAGEAVAVIGRNGAGKSTTLSAIAGLRHGRSSGSVVFGGVDLSRASCPEVVSAGLGHVPEGHRIFATMTVLENLKLGAYTRRKVGRRAVQTALDDVFDVFPVLRDFAERRAGLLSGGQQQMVAIGQALMAKPRMLMLDEPTSGLSLIVIRDILDALERLRADGLGLLFVEQSVPRALKHSDRCYVMERGRVVLAGPSSQLVDNDDVYAIVRGTREALAHG